MLITNRLDAHNPPKHKICVYLDAKQRQLQATNHGEEIGLSAYWLPAYRVFCWRFAHRATQVYSPAHRLHLSVTLPLISCVSSRAGPDSRSSKQAAAKWGVVYFASRPRISPLPVLLLVTKLPPSEWGGSSTCQKKSHA